MPTAASLDLHTSLWANQMWTDFDISRSQNFVHAGLPRFIYNQCIHA